MSRLLPCFQGFNVALQSKQDGFEQIFAFQGQKYTKIVEKIRYMNAKGIIIVQSESDLYTTLEFCHSRHNLDSEDAANKDYKRLEKTRNMYRPVDSHGRWGFRRHLFQQRLPERDRSVEHEKRKALGRYAWSRSRRV